MDDCVPERARTRNAFVARAHWNAAQQTPLNGDASFRRYVRLVHGNRRALLMDAPPQHGEDVRPFIHIDRHLRTLHFSAPEIFAHDAEHGFVLLEDFGEDTFSALLNAGEDEAVLYTLATDVLISLHAMDSTHTLPQGLPPYDDTRLLDEAALLPDWFMAAQNITPSPEARAAYDEAWQEVFRTLHDTPRTLVLRDYHVDNLMRLKGREGVQACGLLDFQDALAGHPAYDLASLLEDARRDVGTEIQSAMKARYHKALGTRDVAAFEAAYAILSAQRHAKVIGIFTRLDRRDAKPVYLRHIPRLWGLLERALTHPILTPVRNWTDAHIAQHKRTIPGGEK